MGRVHPDRLRRCRLVAVALTGLLVLAGCSGRGGDGERSRSVDASSTQQLPGEAWTTAAPADLGLDPGVLQELARSARRAGSQCLLVARDGRLAGEWYFDGTGPTTSHQVFSVTKSIASTLVGIARDDGDLEVESPAARWVRSWRGTAAAKVTVRDLLSNSSGRAWSFEQDYRRLLRARDMTAFAVGLRQAAAPGDTWAYNNSAIQALEPVLESATGQDVATFARERLFEPLGMDDTYMGRDPARNTMLYSGVTSTCRDLARFGVLMLNHGRWGDDQVVSRDWVERATGRSSTRLNAAYGLLWWVNRKGALTGPLEQARTSDLANGSVRQGRYVPGAPPDAFWAVGLGGQVVQVDPGSGTVVVRLGALGAAAGSGSFGAKDTARVLTDGLVTGSGTR